MITLKSTTEMAAMRKAGSMVAETFEALAPMIRPGVSTLELDQAAEEFIRKMGGIPAFKGYGGFPGTICASVNQVVVHGIPGPTRLEEGHIIGIDIGVIYRGYYGDAARTFPVGQVSEEATRLIATAQEALAAGIAQAREGNRLSDISHAVQSLAESRGYSVVRDFVGHGIGQKMHEEPQIPNFGPPGRGPRLKAGMTLAIEPMINCGTYHVKTLADGWTVVTTDGSLSAHVEETVGILPEGPAILTRLGQELTVVDSGL